MIGFQPRGVLVSRHPGCLLRPCSYTCWYLMQRCSSAELCWHLVVHFYVVAHATVAAVAAVSPHCPPTSATPAIQEGPSGALPTGWCACRGGSVGRIRYYLKCIGLPVEHDITTVWWTPGAVSPCTSVLDDNRRPCVAVLLQHTQGSKLATRYPSACMFRCRLPLTNAFAVTGTLSPPHYCSSSASCVAHCLSLDFLLYRGVLVDDPSV
mmetsp:Transcript_39308/g.87472  ORF Transcript_39308/g.87472 Transcript_39308/m.87472 type:complete len:209 (-) Transcript_39308:897-1523(-)